MKDYNIHNHDRNEKTYKLTKITLKKMEMLATPEIPSDISFLSQNVGFDEPNRNPNYL